ncbi:MAG TPA: hypothetical protein EYO34_11855 [Candidatus Marinimicrobia bacterium]|jgi:hypothetical protein|nr:hypothetical protein [Candidatus Neomarinimicrobiota bacterium]
MKKSIFDIYDNTTDFSFLTPDTLRYPPGANLPSGLVNTSKLKRQLSADNAALSPKLQDFTEMYHKMAAGLLNISSDTLIPPGHPIHSRENSVTILKEENKKILKENMELKKKLEEKISKKSRSIISL